MPIRRPLSALITATLALSACAATPATAPAPTAGGAASGAGTPDRLVVGLGYIPSVQFAQFYLAEQRGYYRDAGLDVEFQNKIDPELVTLVGQGAVDVGIADGTSVIAAVSQGIPVRYVASIYSRFPSVVFAKATSGIETAADLKGRKVGIPGKFGSSWVMLQALLKSAGLTPADLEIVLYPDFGQLVGVRQGAVDAATGFVNNEPVQLERSGEDATVLRVDEITPLPGPGLITGEQTQRTKREALRAFVDGTLRAMREIEADPKVGLDAAVKRVPELGQDREGQLAVLRATIETWRSPHTAANGLGAIDRDAWTKSVEFMRSLPESPVREPVTVDRLVSEDLLP